MNDKQPKETPDELARSLAMVLLRTANRIQKSDVSRLAGISTGQVSNYERGKSPVRRDVLERVAGGVGFPTSLLDPLLRGIRSFLVAGRGRSRADRAPLAEVEVHALERLA
ncbi:MAG: helix-turn-helix domain-containing protein, partial [Acidobacteriota bacterium]|nr:helix-turn-helix domain-containing protein [Acidobacteriota bacterium]